MKVLVINSGSSSIKYRLFDMIASKDIAHGLVERIGEKGSILKHWDPMGFQEIAKDISTHKQGLSEVVALLESGDDGNSPVRAIGHRVVHGGETFHAPTLIGEKVMAAIEEYIPLAPLHNPPNLMGIRAAGTHFPGVPQVAVFDTAFHQSIPEYAFRYAIPKEFYQDLKIRRYGFHGTSHQYVAREASKHCNNMPIEAFNAITIHLGNGCSMAAIQNGKSVDTTMGMTPLEGLIMGTRCGDVDPALHGYLLSNSNASHLHNIQDVDKMLNKSSGLKGIVGTNDMRDILALRANGDETAKLAVEMYAYRIKKYTGSYFAVLSGNLNAIVFTAGVGEHSAQIRALSLANLEKLGIVIDELKNKNADPSSSSVIEVQHDSSDVKILVVPTNEELEIAMQTMQVINSTYKA